MERHFGRRIAELSPISSFLDDASNSLGLDSGIRFALNMAVEELYTNMVKYNETGADDILVRVQVQDQRLVIDLIDFDSQPFEFDQRAEIDIKAGLHERKPGGLGIHLIKRYMDDINYEFEDGKTSIRLVKNLKTHA